MLPMTAVKAYTAIELRYMIQKSGLPLEEGLRLLKEAGMDAIPGGGAEIFDAALRERICPQKGTAEEWLEVHRTAHTLGIPTNATILYGHAETLEQRIDHMARLRTLQDETGGVDAFIPLKFRARHNSMEAMGEVSVVEDMKMLAMARIFLDNIPHIKAYWVMYGKSVAEMALAFGADDIDGTIDDSTKIYSMAGAEETAPRLTIAEIEQMASAAGLRATERDTFYNIVNSK
jgi:aminodeoxyfutalosine synthase